MIFGKEKLEKLATISCLYKSIVLQDKDFVYVPISQEVVDLYFSLIEDKNAQAFSFSPHISVIYPYELPEDTEIKEIGEEVNFNLGDMKSVIPVVWTDMQRIWVIEVECPQLEKLREKYGLSPKLNGHNFHITAGVEPKWIKLGQS